MDSREIYAALFMPRGPVGEPSGEWVFVGDSACFDQERFYKVIVSLGEAPELLVAVSRTKAVHVTAELVGLTVQQFLRHGEVRVSNIGLTHFIHVSTVGVARSWQRSA